MLFWLYLLWTYYTTLKVNYYNHHIFGIQIDISFLALMPKNDKLDLWYCLILENEYNQGPKNFIDWTIQNIDNYINFR